MDIQAYFDGLSKQWKKERSETQMTLGKMISRLKELPESLQIQGISDPHSYRGYYEDIAFEPTSKKVSIAALLKECESSMGQVFCGYKGGDFVMGALTPVWVANYGSCGIKLISIRDDGTLETKEGD